MSSANDSVDDSPSGPTRPRFRGCLVCYSLGWLRYGVRRITGSD